MSWVGGNISEHQTLVQSGEGIRINGVTAVMLKAQHGAELNGLKIIEITFSLQHTDYQVLIAVLATIFHR